MALDGTPPQEVIRNRSQDMQEWPHSRATGRQMFAKRGKRNA